MNPEKLSIIKKIRNQSWVNISTRELEDLEKIGFIVERGTSHYKVHHNGLKNSNTKYSSGFITVGTHQKDKERVDYNGAQDLKQALKYLKYL
jgi:hypothetical protein